jgi:hypothetical protein
MTELGYAGELPTNDFLRWHGQRFKPKPKTESRGGKVAQGVAEKRHTDGGGNPPHQNGKVWRKSSA